MCICIPHSTSLAWTSRFEGRGSSVHKAWSVLICCCPRNREKGPGPVPSHDTDTGQRAAGHLTGAVHHAQNKMCSYASIRQLSSWQELFPPTRPSSQTGGGKGGRGGARAQSKHLLQAVPGHQSPQHAQSWPSLLRPLCHPSLRKHQPPKGTVAHGCFCLHFLHY